MMKVRGLITGAIALALVGAGTLTSSAKADENFDRDVGGGVAAIQANVEVGTSALNVINKDYATATETYGRAVMGRNGGYFVSKLVDKTVGPVTVRAAYENIQGRRSGLPAYAAGRSLLSGIRFGGNKDLFRALDVTCLWNRSAASGLTTVTDANGNVTKPELNTEVPIAGLGTLVLNEQYIRDEYKYDPTGVDPNDKNYPFRVYQVIYVFGAHLYLNAGNSTEYGIADIILGFTSCDPTKLPSLGSLSLGKNYT